MCFGLVLMTNIMQKYKKKLTSKAVSFYLIMLLILYN